jgi:hypothetical protein
MRSRKRRVSREAKSIASNLMFAPMVMWMRLPVMAAEAGNAGAPAVETMRAISEKTEAVAEGIMAAQMSLARSAARFWPEILSGRTPSILNGVAAERSVNAALGPSGRRVKANYERLMKSK